MATSNKPNNSNTKTAQNTATKKPSRSEVRRARRAEKTVSDSRVIHFMRFEKPMWVLSVFITVISLGAIFMNGLNLGLDFTGGVSAEVVYEKPTTQTEVTNALAQAEFKDPVVQYLGNQRELIVRMPAQQSTDLTEKITTALQLPDNIATVTKVDSVGSQVGNQLYLRSLGALALALISMLIYVAVRFQYKLAVGAVLSLVHDTIFTVGMFALFKWPFDLTVLAAVLALIGYSLNDTIVVFDRIRENFRKIRQASPIEIADISLTETLRRTIMTVVTVLLVVVSMLFLGGDGLRWFSVALLVGLIAGTYSSIYIASSYALAMGLSRKDFIVQVKPEFSEDVVEFVEKNVKTGKIKANKK